MKKRKERKKETTILLLYVSSHTYRARLFQTFLKIKKKKREKKIKILCREGNGVICVDVVDNLFFDGQESSHVKIRNLLLLSSSTCHIYIYTHMCVCVYVYIYTVHIYTALQPVYRCFHPIYSAYIRKFGSVVEQNIGSSSVNQRYFYTKCNDDDNNRLIVSFLPILPAVDRLDSALLFHAPSRTRRTRGRT